MTNDELRALCERVIKDRETLLQCGFYLKQLPSIAEGFLRLLRENEAMRSALESIVDHHHSIKSVSNPHPALEALSETYYARAKLALSKLESP